MSNQAVEYQFDIATLRTDFSPDNTQAMHIKNTVSLENNVLSELLHKVGDLEEQLHSLRAECQAVYSSVSIHGALVAPIRRLSPELLMEIFERCTGGRPSFSARKSPLLLTHICHKWRRIAHASPRLWTHIAIGARYPQKSVDLACSTNVLFRRDIMSTEPIDFWLRNSGSLPLDISVQLNKGSNSKELSRALLQQLPRCSKASISGDIDTLNEMIPFNKPLGLVHLQSFSIECLAQSYPIQSPPVARWDTPYLHSLTLERANFFIDIIQPTSSLRRLVIRGEKEEISLAPWTLFLKSCVALDTLEIPLNCIVKEDTFQTAPEDPLELRFLRRLILTLRASPTGNIALPPRFRAPQLQQLAFSGFGYHEEAEPVTRALDNIIVGCRSAIKDLSFCGHAFPEETNRRWLTLLTAVECLSVTSECLAILIPPNPADVNHTLWTCPKLLTLRILDYQAGCGLKELVKCRSLPRGSSPQIGAHYLKQLDLSGLRWRYFPESTWKELRGVSELGNSRDLMVYGFTDDE